MIAGADDQRKECLTYLFWLAQALLDGVTAAFYNAFFTAGPICAFALFDRPVRDLDTLMDFPQHYNRRPALTTRVFWKTGILWAITHAAVSVMLCMLTAQVMELDTAHSAQRTISDLCKARCARRMFACLLWIFELHSIPQHAHRHHSKQWHPAYLKSCRCKQKGALRR